MENGRKISRRDKNLLRKIEHVWVPIGILHQLTPWWRVPLTFMRNDSRLSHEASSTRLHQRVLRAIKISFPGKRDFFLHPPQFARSTIIDVSPYITVHVRDHNEIDVEDTRHRQSADHCPSSQLGTMRQFARNS